MAGHTYCKRWNDVKKAPMEVLSVDAAAALHAARKPYTVVIDCDGDLIVVEMCFYHVYCHVAFLDELKRERVVYSFDEVSEDRLFMSRAAFHYYKDDTDSVARGEILYFSEDGAVIEDVGTSNQDIMRREGKMDVQSNYSPVPAFGNYDEITDFDRDNVTDIVE